MFCLEVFKHNKLKTIENCTMKFQAHLFLEVITILLATAVSAQQQCETNGEKPNIVFLLVDDWGSGDVVSSFQKEEESSLFFGQTITNSYKNPTV